MFFSHMFVAYCLSFCLKDISDVKLIHFKDLVTLMSELIQHGETVWLKGDEWAVKCGTLVREK